MFKIYSKSQCPFCVQSKMLLNRIGQEYNEVDIEEDIEKHRAWMKSIGVKTVPQIYYKDEYIGGFESLQDYLVENDFV